VYEKAPATPYRRLRESSGVSDERKAELKRRKDGQNPVELNTKLNEAVDRLLKINREKASMKQASGQEAEQAQAV
jgi:succinate dehydrogenase/fumarate reductase flavoprotein subunit